MMLLRPPPPRPLNTTRAGAAPGPDPIVVASEAAARAQLPVSMQELSASVNALGPDMFTHLTPQVICVRGGGMLHVCVCGGGDVTCEHVCHNMTQQWWLRYEVLGGVSPEF